MKKIKNVKNLSQNLSFLLFPVNQDQTLKPKKWLVHTLGKPVEIKSKAPSLSKKHNNGTRDSTEGQALLDIQHIGFSFGNHKWFSEHGQRSLLSTESGIVPTKHRARSSTPNLTTTKKENHNNYNKCTYL